jgi:hypothetical protein
VGAFHSHHKPKFSVTPAYSICFHWPLPGEKGPAALHHEKIIVVDNHNPVIMKKFGSRPTTTRLLRSRDLHYCHIDSYRPNTVSTETKFKQFITCNHGNNGDSFVEVTIHIYMYMVLGYDLLCELLEILNFNKYRSAVATRRNLVDPIEEYNGLAVRAFDLRYKVRIPMETLSFQFIFYFYV